MRKLLKAHQLLSGVLSVLISVFLVTVAVYAATTIGTNINTAGTVTMESASTTNDFWLGNVIADDDDYLYFDASGTEYIMWDDSPGEFDFSDDLNITGVTTSSLAFWAGAGGTVNNINMTGGDLYVQNDAEIDGILWGNWATTTSATTTDYLYVGTDITELSGWDFSGGDLIVSGDAHFAAKATSTTAFAVGAGTINTPDMAGGDLYVQGDAEVDGSLTLGGGSEISAAYFGSCTVDLADTLAAGESSSTDCTATGVLASDTVFITPDWLEPGINFLAASGTTDLIRVWVNNASTSAVTTAANTWRWMAIR